jgi:hypothetical protein
LSAKIAKISDRDFRERQPKTEFADVNDDDNQVDSKVIVVEDNVDKKLNASKNDEEQVKKEKNDKKKLNQKNKFDVLLEF